MFLSPHPYCTSSFIYLFLGGLHTHRYIYTFPLHLFAQVVGLQPLIAPLSTSLRHCARAYTASPLPTSFPSSSLVPYYSRFALPLRFRFDFLGALHFSLSSPGVGAHDDHATPSHPQHAQNTGPASFFEGRTTYLLRVYDMATQIDLCIRAW